MQQITETEKRRIKVISFGTKGKDKTAQVVVIHKGDKEKKERTTSATFHLHFMNGSWFFKERIMQAGNVIEQLTEFVCEKLPKASPQVVHARAA